MRDAVDMACRFKQELLASRINLDELRRLAFQGIPDKDGLRAMTWKVESWMSWAAVTLQSGAMAAAALMATAAAAAEVMSRLCSRFQAFTDMRVTLHVCVRRLAGCWRALLAIAALQQLFLT